MNALSSKGYKGKKSKPKASTVATKRATHSRGPLLDWMDEAISEIEPVVGLLPEDTDEYCGGNHGR